MNEKECINIIYLSTALSDGIYDGIIKECRSFKPTFSGIGFDRNIGVGLASKYKVHGFSLYPIPSWPKYSKIMEKEAPYEYKGFECCVLRIFNIPIIKELSYFFQIKKKVKKLEINEGKTIVIVSGLYRSLLRAASFFKKKYGFKICAIVPDIPEIMIEYRTDYSSIRKILNRIDVSVSKAYRTCIDYYALLTEYMNDVVNNFGKPSIVLDGLCDTELIQKTDSVVIGEKYILYAGKISKKFGVDKLVEAFLSANIDEIKLYLCGDGDLSTEIEKISEEDRRIVYLRTISHEQVLKLEKGATLLVEPRPSDSSIVKLSFPSKIIEYMASGTPVLTTNLPCFSEEYKKYQYRINDESIKGIKAALIEFFSLDENIRFSKAQEAKEFIYNNKSINNQCERIVRLITKTND